LSLPDELEEVSGLSRWTEGQVAMVNDEQGIIFCYGLEEEKIVRKISFALPGDFEGIERVGDIAYALRSDGIIFQMENLENESPDLTIIRTLLSEDDDTEGLGYDPQTGHLLVACKEPSRYHDWDDRWRAVYTFVPEEGEMLRRPLDIDLAEIKAVLAATAQTEQERERADDFEVKKKKSFKPSAIAVHPLSGHYYLLASAGKLLLVVTREGRVVSTQHLPRNPFSQPEGICFAENGDLFISNEARDGRASLLRFTYQPE